MLSPFCFFAYVTMDSIVTTQTLWKESVIPAQAGIHSSACQSRFPPAGNSG